MAHKKNVETHKKNGTYRPDRHIKNEEAGALIKVLPGAPFPLSAEAGRVYIEEGKQLIAQSLLKASDIRLLAMYATEIGVYIEEMSAALEEGVIITLPNGISTTSAHRKAAESALKNASGLADKLALSPAARVRLGVETPSAAAPGRINIIDYIKGGAFKKTGETAL